MQSSRALYGCTMKCCILLAGHCKSDNFRHMQTINAIVKSLKSTHLFRSFLNLANVLVTVTKRRLASIVLRKCWACVHAVESHVSVIFQIHRMIINKLQCNELQYLCILNCLPSQIVTFIFQTLFTRQ